MKSPLFKQFCIEKCLLMSYQILACKAEASHAGSHLPYTYTDDFVGVARCEVVNVI